MIERRKPLALIFALCYLWVMAIPLVALCPCQPTAKPTSDVYTDCCSQDISAACCPGGEPVSDKNARHAESPAACCQSEKECPDCPRCLSSNLEIQIFDNPRLIPVPGTIENAEAPTSLISPDRLSIAFYQVPDHPRLAVHIPSTVLRC